MCGAAANSYLIPLQLGAGVRRRVDAQVYPEVPAVQIQFDECIPLEAAQVYSYFATPAAWVRLYGFAGRVDDRGGGWYAVPLKRFPFPLVARITHSEPPRFVRWEFRGFWRGGGEVRLTDLAGGVRIDGHEEISVRWLPGISWLLERLFMEREFRRIWALGWRRLRKAEQLPAEPAGYAHPVRRPVDCTH